MASMSTGAISLISWRESSLSPDSNMSVGKKPNSTISGVRVNA